MAPLPYVRVALLVGFSVFLTIVLGFGLPTALSFLARCCGYPDASVTECVVAVYLVFVVYVAMPRLPRGTVKEDGDGAKELKEMHSERMKVLQLDVCSEEQVAESAEFVKANLEDSGKAGLWALVNNAGVSTFGEVEFTSMETYKQVSEVNLWGTIRITKALLPLIRRTKGRVVNLASMYGRMGNALRSPYCISKYGVEAFTDCLRYEMKPWGVKVSLIEPGNFVAATGILSRDLVAATADKLWREAPPVVQEDYGKSHFEQHMALMRSYCGSGQRDVVPVLEDITDAIVSQRPFTRYNPMEPHWWIRMQVMTHLPAAISDRLYF
ncbi:D-beta-hydroxybutyrate dehydrogenase, mitochondrial isoform X3 [Alosa alosa]|uniref:D-beta-hydroxybutyrate dehydrogenase, mitochondrial isoform X3 n=1 Tax=Alosa alosa TaxID=278164 RepID=UPI0020151775|nr:D-beta-hydroxybutyrate dehydrogenase, mitochondrial isoform X3 [Alosa alosa]